MIVSGANQIIPKYREIPANWRISGQLGVIYSWAA